MMNIKEFDPYITKKPLEGCCMVINKGGTQMVTMPDGTVIPRQVWSRVYTGVDQPPYVIVKLHINPSTIENVPHETSNPITQ